MKNNLTLFAREGKAKSLQNTGGGASRHEALIIAEQFSQCQTSRSEGARQSTAQHGSARVFEYFNTQMARFLWNKKGEATVSKSSCSWAQGRATSAEQPTNHALITHLSPTQTVSLARIWKYVACLLLVLFVGVGQMWGAEYSGTVTFYKSSSALTTSTITNSNNKVSFTYSDLSANSSSASICSNGSQYGIKGKNKTLITVTCPDGYYFTSAQFSLGSFGNTETPKAEIFSGSTRLYECSAHKYTKLDACGNVFSCEDSIANFASNKYTTLSVKETGNSKNLGVAKLVYTIAEIDGGGDDPGDDPGDTPANYAVTHTLTNNVAATSGATGASAATEGSAYNAVFAANKLGYSLPSTIGVTIGGEAATVGTDYTWNSSTGAFQVPAAKVTGNIVVTIAGVAPVKTFKSDYSDFTQVGETNAYYTYLTQDNYTSYAATGWMEYDVPKTGEQKLLIDPATDEATTPDSKSTYGIVKQVDTRYMEFYLTGITSVKFYFHNSNSSNDRTIKYKLNDGDGTDLVTVNRSTSNSASIALSSSTENTIRIYADEELYVCAMKVTLPDASCGVTAPGTISAGALTDGTITLTADGSPAENNVWYWQSSASGTDKTGTSGASKTVSAAGTYYLRSYHTVDDCWSDAESYELTAADFIAHYAITYNKGTYGTGSIEAGSKTEDVDFTLSSQMFTRDGYVQVGWATTDGGTKAYDLGGSYTANAAQTFYPVWAPKETYTAAFEYDSEHPTTAPAGWTFANDGTYTNSSATVTFVGTFAANGETTASGKGMNVNHIAFAKSTDADAIYDLGYSTTISAVTGTLMIGSTKEKVASIDYLAADGSTVKHSFEITHNKTDWGANDFNETDVVPNVRYIRINGKDFWQVLGAFSVKYGDLTPKYTVTYVPNNGVEPAETMTDSDSPYKAGTEVTLLTNTFTAPSTKEFDAWVVTPAAGGDPITITNGKFTMPSANVNVTATWRVIATKYSVTYVLNGPTGDAPTEADQAEGDEFTLASEPSWSGHVFQGWQWTDDKSVTHLEDAEAEFTMPAYAVTFTAQWKLDPQATMSNAQYVIGGSALNMAAKFSSLNTEGSVSFSLKEDYGDDASITPAGSFTATVAGEYIVVAEQAGDGTYAKGEAEATVEVLESEVEDIFIFNKKADYGGDGKCLTADQANTADGAHKYVDIAYEGFTGMGRAATNNTECILTFSVKSAYSSLFGIKDICTYGKFEEPLGGKISWDGGTNWEDLAKYSEGKKVFEAPGTFPTSFKIKFLGVSKDDGGLWWRNALVTLERKKAIKNTVIDLTDVKINGTSISAANLATLKTGPAYALDLADEYVTAPTLKFNKHTVITYDDESVVAKDDVISKTATVNLSGKWEASAEINEITYTVTMAKADAFVVHYYEGETLIGSENVAVSGHPTAAGITPTPQDFKRVVWTRGGVAVDLEDVTSDVAGTEISLVASYVSAYASSINIEQWVLDNKVANKAGFIAELEGKGYKQVDLNALDSLNDDPNKANRNYAFLGMKVNKSTSAISLLLKAGSTVRAKFGNVGNDVNVIIGEAEPVVLTSEDYANTSVSSANEYSYTAEADVVVKFQSTGTSTVVFKQIMIDEAIADVTLPWLVTYDAGANGTCATASEVWRGSALTLPSVTPNTNYNFDGWSDGENLVVSPYTPTANITLTAQYSMEYDNRLASLEFNGEELDGFDPDKGVYYTTVPYSTTLPKVTGATLVDDEAEYTIQDASWNDELGYYIAQVYVTPVAGSVKFYQVRYTMDPKQGVSIIKVMIPNGTGNDQEIAAANITGYIGGTAIQKIQNGDHKLGSKGHYIGITLAEGTFQENDLVNVNIETVAGDKLRVFSENTAAEAKVVAQSAANMVAGVNTVILGATTTSSLYLRRGTDGEAYQTAWNPYVGYFEVQRYMDPIIKSFKVGDVIATIDEEADPKTITLEVPYSTDITSLIPEIEAYANGGATITPSTAQDFSKGAVNYTVTSVYDETTTYAVTISKAEASHDATLSALSVAGYNIGFEASKLSYNVELPKGSVLGDLPVVSYTKNHTGATAVKTDATALPGSTTIVVTAEDESTTKTYTINFTVSTMDKYVIFSGQTDALEAVPVTPTGLNWEKNSDSEDKFKFIEYTYVAGYTNAILTGGSSNASRNISVTIPADYEAVFEIAQASNSDAARRAYVGAANNTGYADALFSIESTSKTDGQKAKSDVLAGGKTYYIHSDNSINILELNVYLDRVSETPVISAEPADMSVCEYGTDELTVTAAVSEGTLSYQWYKEVEGDDDETVGTNSASYTPAAAGKYYVIITNTQGTYKPSSVISEVATVTDQAVTAITTAPEDVRKDVGEEATLTVVATGLNCTYVWYTCDDAEGTNPVAIVPAETGASLNVTVPSGEQYYMVVVSSDCGEPVSAVAKVAEWREVPQANVTESITWDWTSSAWPAGKNISFSPEAGDLKLLANVSSLVPANSGFRADMLLGSGQYIWRDGGEDKKCFQGNTLKFHTEVAGAVTVYYRSTSSGKDITININGTAAGHHSMNTYTASEQVLIPANSDVEITKTGETYIRINKIVFQTLDELTPDYSRPVTQGYYGTICLPNGGIMVGASLFELAYFDATQEKIFFDEILNGVMVAGTPYIFLPTEGASQLGVYYTDAANAEAGHANGLYGSYTEEPLAADGSNYILYNNKYYLVDSENVWVGANRAYIKLGEAETVSSPALAPKPKAGCRRIAMGAYSEQTATGIGNVQGDQVQNTKVMIDGQLFIIRGDKMYDATGKQVK